MQSETKNCQNCKNSFVIEPEDFGFYEKINVPPPTFCPDCRRQRRWAWRNNMSLYSRHCAMCSKPVVSIYSPGSEITVYCNKCWWSDKWDPKSYAAEYDFSKPFFSQFRELIKKVPHMAVVNDDGIASVNCEFTHDWWFSKNCYMCFSGWHVENVMYSFFVLAGRDITDCLIIRSKSERLYDCYMTSNGYNIKYSNINKACIDSQFLYDCIECQDCLMCTGLRNKRYHYKNKEYSKEEYEKILENYKLDTWSGVQRAKEEYNKFILNHPRRYALLFRCQSSQGDIISDSKNVKYSFIGKNSENCRYSDFFGDSSGPDKDCYDITMSGGVSESYESVVADHSQMNMFGLLSVKSQDIKYSHHCHNCKHIFGCIGLRNANYCIFNKQYTKEEYEELTQKIIKQTNEVPYTDKSGNIYKYGEFYPIELSYFGYNETNAIEEFPLSQDQAVSKGYKWEENIQRTTGKETIKTESIPDSIKDVDDKILEEVLACTECKRNYRIVQNELIFYKKMEVPIPRKCFYCRHEERVGRRNPFRFWHRSCMCDKKSHFHKKERCPNEFETTYSPERPEIVYCEKCYQAEVY